MKPTDDPTAPSRLDLELVSCRHSGLLSTGWCQYLGGSPICRARWTALTQTRPLPLHPIIGPWQRPGSGVITAATRQMIRRMINKKLLVLLISPGLIAAVSIALLSASPSAFSIWSKMLMVSSEQRAKVLAPPHWLPLRSLIEFKGFFLGPG